MAPASPESPAGEGITAGREIGEYRIVRLLGEGGMGVVWEATHRALNRRAAIKFLRPELTSNPGVVARFLQEARAVNLINHDNIVDIYDYGELDDGSVYFVMEFIEGEDLTELQARERPLPLDKTIAIYRQIMRALAAAHAKGIVHRDLKPDNVFLARRENNPQFVKLLDFGIAKLRGEGAGAALTRAGTLMGTPQFMSPEQAQGHAVDASSDIFSLGVMLYQSVTGTLPFDGGDLRTVITKIVREEPAPVRRATPESAGLPADLEAMILRAMRKKPSERYASVGEMLADLEAVEVRAGQVAATPTAVEVEVEPRRRGWLPWAAAAAVIALAAVIAIVALGRRDDGAAKEGSAIEADAGGLASLGDRVRAGDLAAVKREAHASLEAALGGDPGGARVAVEAMILARTPALAPLLYRALEGSPPLRVGAARALRELGLPDAAPKIRAAMSRSGGRIAVELAGALLVLGDPAAMPVIERALAGGPAEQLIAAAAVAEAVGGDREVPGAIRASARAALDATLRQTTPGRDRWRAAAGALARLGDPAAIEALARELAASDPGRAVAAAAILSALDDPASAEYLERVIADEGFAARGAAAVALARAGGVEALELVGPVLADPGADPDLTRWAIAVAATLAEQGGAKHAAAIAERAGAADIDARVRATALAALVAF
jgi:tRNA A-37 threonylcarbamoyl transferase component Bud32/HEAT repeat protein